MSFASCESLIGDAWDSKLSFYVCRCVLCHSVTALPKRGKEANSVGPEYASILLCVLLGIPFKDVAVANARYSYPSVNCSEWFSGFLQGAWVAFHTDSCFSMLVGN